MRDTEEKQIIIDAVNVRYSYEENTSEAGAAEAVRGVSMQVYRGEFLCVLGHNGSGKSTLAKLLNGLFTPTSGSVTVCGMNTNEEDKQLEIRKSAGMVFQNPDNQLVATIVEEDVAFGPESGRGPGGGKYERICAQLPPQAFGRTEAAHSHSGRAGHAA